MEFNPEHQHEWVEGLLLRLSNPPQRTRWCDVCGVTQETVLGKWPEEAGEEQEDGDK